MLFGRPVDFSRIRSVGGLRASEASGLSGGQMQRLAVYVTVF
jgi:energy-coupling factor transporter ATP-binding protein EcfA2